MVPSNSWEFSMRLVHLSNRWKGRQCEKIISLLKVSHKLKKKLGKCRNARDSSVACQMFSVWNHSLLLLLSFLPRTCRFIKWIQHTLSQREWKKDSRVKLSRTPHNSFVFHSIHYKIASETFPIWTFKVVNYNLILLIT